MRKPSRNTLLRILAHLLWLGGVLIFISLPVNQYEWMLQIDPARSALPVDHAADSRLLVSLLLLLAILATQGLIVIKAPGRTEKGVSMLLMVVAVALWWLRLTG
jgi:hypothetical protein